jgi:type IX secretion system PorP/SprF family membrane protein
MRKIHTYLSFAVVVLLVIAVSQRAVAQQDPMYTKYMFNSLAFNPAYAGTSDYLSATAIVRDQWLSWGKGLNSIEGGAPVTYALSVHSPIKNKVGLGGYISQDNIGASIFTQLAFSYAYRLQLKDDLQLSAGLQGGITHQNFDYSGLNIRHPNDGNFMDGNGQAWLPNAGAGLYLYAEKFYVGASVPRLFESRILIDEIGGNSNGLEASTYRHMYIASGAAFPINGNDDLVLKPSILIKGVGWLGDFATSSQTVQNVRTPTAFDLDVSMLFYKTLWLGVSYRSTFDKEVQGNSSSDSADIWGAVYLKNGMRIGVAYDYNVQGLQSQTNGSAELMIGYDMNFNVDKIVTPRYF